MSRHLMTLCLAAGLLSPMMPAAQAQEASSMIHDLPGSHFGTMQDYTYDDSRTSVHRLVHRTSYRHRHHQLGHRMMQLHSRHGGGHHS